jgi:hypothetical protein
MNEIPPTPLYKRGAANRTILYVTSHLPPLLKGDRGGFYCAFVFPKITAAYLLDKQGTRPYMETPYLSPCRHPWYLIKVICIPKKQTLPMHLSQSEHHNQRL